MCHNQCSPRLSRAFKFHPNNVLYSEVLVPSGGRMCKRRGRTSWIPYSWIELRENGGIHHSQLSSQTASQAEQPISHPRRTPAIIITHNFFIYAHWGLQTHGCFFQRQPLKQTQNIHFHLQDKIHCDASPLASLKPCQGCSILKLLFRGGSVLQLTCWECSNSRASKLRSEARPRVQLCFSSCSTSRTCPKDATAP